MKFFVTFMISVFIGVSLSLAVISDAEAKRFGGGRSFGGKSGYSSPAKRSTPSGQTARSATPAQQQNNNMRQSYSQRGGMMGMLGGLALGGMLGAMFFGGAFENINFMDILLFAGIAYLVYRLFAARKRRAQAQGAMAGGAVAAGGGGLQHRHPTSAGRGFDTDLMSKRGAGSGQVSAPAKPPAGFDERTFMDGAQYAYRQLQASWDKGELSDIRNLTTDAVYNELESQVKDRQGRNRTDILKLRTQLLEVKEDNGQWVASVLYDAQLREMEEHSASKPSPKWVREVWHFTRPAKTDKPTWYLDGIQQLEE